MCKADIARKELYFLRLCGMSMLCYGEPVISLCIVLCIHLVLWFVQMYTIALSLARIDPKISQGLQDLKYGIVGQIELNIMISYCKSEYISLLP